MNKVFFGHLNLAYNPISVRDFTIIKEYDSVKSAIANSTLYVIGQRPELSMENIVLIEDENVIEFDIVQSNSVGRLSCSLSILANNLMEQPVERLVLSFGSNDQRVALAENEYNDVHSIQVFKNEQKDENFVCWIMPENFLYNYWNNLIKAKVIGDLNVFLKYKVHYVGIATKQGIWKRLTGHHALQDILSLESPEIASSLHANEIVLLLYQLDEHFHMKSYGINDDISGMVDSLQGKGIPSIETVTKDAEKAIVKCLHPKYNKELFKNYPKSKDGLYKHKYNGIIYSFNDPLTLTYRNGEICGSTIYGQSDSIAIREQESPILIKTNC